MISKPVKLLRPEQANDISEMILEIAVKSYIRGEITNEEKDGIINFTAQMNALIRVFDEEGLILH